MVEIRDQAFDLRKQGLSYKKIGEQLGVSASTIHKILHQPVRPNGEEDPLISPSPLLRRAAPPEDPALAESYRDLERKKLQLASAQLDVQLAGVSRPGSEGAIAALLMQRLESIERSVDRRLAQTPAAAPVDPLHALAEGLGTLARVQQQVTALQPPAPVRAVTAGDLELTVAMRKVEIEEKALIEKAASEARRNDMFTEAIKQFIPLGTAALQQWWSKQMEEKPGPPTLALIQGGAAPRPGPPPKPVRMTCSNCGAGPYEVVPEPGELLVCQLCGGPLQPSEAQKQAAAASKPNWPEDATFG
jgi:hypothetical protein